MSDQDAFDRILATLYDAMLNDASWPTASALIDEACGGLQGHVRREPAGRGRGPLQLRGIVPPGAAPH